MPYVIGLDNGGTLSKAALFDLEGKELAAAGRQTALLTPRAGFMERDMEQLWQANCACIREVLECSGARKEEVLGIAVGGHGKGLYPWGKDGRPACNGIVSNDNRAWKYPRRWEEDGTAGRLYPQLCQKLLPGQPTALLAWMKEHEPAVYENIRWVFSVKDYIRFRLTGEAYNEVTDLSGSGLMDVKNARVDPGILEALGIGEAAEKIAPLRYSCDNCGAVTGEAAELTGLAPGAIVAGGMFDIDACAIAMDATGPEKLVSITGTWSINEYISRQPVLGTETTMNSLFAIPGYYLVEECSPSGAGNLEWVLDNLMANEPLPEGKKRYHLADELVDGLRPEESDVYFLPFLYGSNAHPLARAGFVGLTSFHSRGDLLRAVYESAAYTAKVHIDRLLKVRKAPEAVSLAGGAANAPLWVQMFADILGLPVETVEGVKELGALGCAMAAAVAAGAYPDYQAAAKAMVRVNRRVYPNPQRVPIYAEKYEKYRAVVQALDSVWDRFE